MYVPCVVYATMRVHAVFFGVFCHMYAIHVKEMHGLYRLRICRWQANAHTGYGSINWSDWKSSLVRWWHVAARRLAIAGTSAGLCIRHSRERKCLLLYMQAYLRDFYSSSVWPNGSKCILKYNLILRSCAWHALFGCSFIHGIHVIQLYGVLFRN